MLKNLIFMVSVCLFFTCAAFGQQATTSKNFQIVEIEKFAVRDGVEFPAEKVDPLMRSILKTLQKSNRFEQVFLADDSSAEQAPMESRIKISGEITKYVKGNRAVRYMVGLGAGATKIIADIKFINAETGETILTQTVDGDVTWGLFGGDSDDAKSGVADEIIRVMKKNNFAGEKKKTQK